LALATYELLEIPLTPALSQPGRGEKETFPSLICVFPNMSFDMGKSGDIIKLSFESIKVSECQSIKTQNLKA